MQSKINSFFKPSSSSSSTASSSVPASVPPDSLPFVERDCDDGLAVWEKSRHLIANAYERRSATAYRSKTPKECIRNTANKHVSRKGSTSASKNLHKKRSYAQFHLELGQSDFLLRNCSTCGVKYAPGDEVDETNHRTFHKNYVHGVPFKGWRNERTVTTPSLGEGRIIMVLENDSPAHRNKVEEVVKMMEVELGEDWILSKHFKVYLFISSQRVAGCLVAEPISEAFRLIPRLEDERHITSANSKKAISHSTTIQFGNAILQREVSKKSRPSEGRFHNGAIVCEEEAQPAVCGVRAIWVTPSNRRKGIATHLLHALRKSFCDGCVLEKSQMAFSQPSSLGTAFGSSFFGTSAFLVYKAEDSSC